MSLPLNPEGLFLLVSSLPEITAAFGVMSIVFGIIILLKPNIIAYLIAAYLILTGLLALVGGSL